jgi:hypothetical protein
MPDFKTTANFEKTTPRLSEASATTRGAVSKADQPEKIGHGRQLAAGSHQISQRLSSASAKLEVANGRN